MRKTPFSRSSHRTTSALRREDSRVERRNSGRDLWRGTDGLATTELGSADTAARHKSNSSTKQGSKLITLRQKVCKSTFFLQNEFYRKQIKNSPSGEENYGLYTLKCLRKAPFLRWLELGEGGAMVYLPPPVHGPESHNETT